MRPTKIVIFGIALVSLMSVGFSIQQIACDGSQQLPCDGGFETTINLTSNPHWHAENGQSYSTSSPITGIWSTAGTESIKKQLINVSSIALTNDILLFFRFNGLVTGSGYAVVRVDLLANDSTTIVASPLIYNTDVPYDNTGIYNYTSSLRNFTLPAGYRYIQIYLYGIDTGGLTTKYDDFALTRANGLLLTPSASNIGPTFNFAVNSNPDTSGGYLLYVNLSCGLSTPQQQVSNQLLTYDIVSHTWKATNINVPNCAGSYNATFFGTRFGYNIFPASVLRESAAIRYTLTTDSSIWAPNQQRKLNLTFYDVQTLADITSYVSKGGNGLLNTTLAEITDPNNYAHSINFYYNSGTNKFEANYTTQNILCGVLNCTWAKDYLMNLTGITLTGYETLNIRLTYTPPTFNITGTFYFDKDKTGSLTSPDVLLNGYDLKLVRCSGTVLNPQDQCGEEYGYITSTTDSNGKFSFSVYIEGSYIIYPLIVGSYAGHDFESGYANYYGSKWPQKAYKIITVGSDKNNTYYTVPDEGIYASYGSTGNLNFSFASHGSLINFTAKNSTGSKLSGINIAVTALESSSGTQGITKSCTTGADGTCHVIVMDKLNGFPYGYQVVASGTPYATKTMTVSANDFIYGTNFYRGSYRTYQFNMGGGRYFITDINGNVNNITFSPINALAGEYMNYIRFKILDTEGTSSYVKQYYVPMTPTGIFTCTQDECKITAIRLFFSPSAHDVGVPYCKMKQESPGFKSNMVPVPPCYCTSPYCQEYLGSTPLTDAVWPSGGCIEFLGIKTQCNYECSGVIGGCGSKIKINGTEHDFDSTGKYLTTLNMKKGDTFSWEVYSQGMLIGKVDADGIVITSEEKRNSNFYRCDTFGQRCVEGQITVTKPAGCGSPSDQWTTYGQYLYATQGSEEWNAVWVDGSQQSDELWGSAMADWKLTCNASNTINVRIQDLDIDQTFYYNFGAGKWTENRYKEAFLNLSAQTLKFKFGLTSQLFGQQVYPTSAKIAVTELNSSAQYTMTVNGSYAEFTYGGVIDPAGSLYHYALEVNVPDYTYNMTSNTSYGVIYSSIDHYSDVNCGLTPVTQVPGLSQEAFCRLKTINGTTVTQTNNLIIKIDTSVGNSPYETAVPFSSFDGDYNYYKATVTLVNYSLSQSGLGAFFSLSDYAEGNVRMAITDPNGFYPFYDIMVPYKLDENAINVEPSIKTVSLYKELVRPGVEPFYIQTTNISTNDNILCNLTYSDTQNLVYNTSFELWGGSGNATQISPAKYSPTTSAYGYSALWLFDLDSDGRFNLGNDAQFCCKGVLHYKWAGIDKKSSLTTCTIVNPTTPPTPSFISGGELFNLASFANWVIQNPLQFVLLIIMVVVFVPIIMYLLH